MSIATIFNVTSAEPNTFVWAKTHTSHVKGFWVGAHDSPVARFSGIRFARAQRWQTPELEPLQGDVDATVFAPICPQQQGNTAWYERVAAAFGKPSSVVPPRPAISEDCLFLNVWTPSPKPTAQLPVMVWIHGGSNKNGYSYEPNYRGHTIAGEGVVVVSIAYRLGVLGFLAHPDFDVPGSGNFGLLDQIAALEWIKTNVTAFGGDPNNITLFGESAGAADIGYLSASPQAQFLFQRAISQSGGWQVDRVADIARQSELGADYANSQDGLAVLQKMPVERLIDSAAAHFTGHYWDPTVEGHTIPATMPQLMQTDGVARKPLLIGFNSDEGLMYQPEDVSEETWQTWIQASYGNEAKFIEARMAGLPLRTRMNALTTAANYACPSRIWAAYNSEKSTSYIYEFATNRTEDHGLGAYHGAEIPYIFNTHDDWLPTTDKDTQLTQSMLKYWVNFARNGDPNGPGLKEWPLYKDSKPMALQLTPEPKVVLLDDEICGVIRRR